MISDSLDNLDSYVFLTVDAITYQEIVSKAAYA